MNKIDFSNAKWIWTKDNKSIDQKVVFRKKFYVDVLPDIANSYIACDTKFWLWVNGQPVVYEGGVFRESTNGCGYGFMEMVEETILTVGKPDSYSLVRN